jgi:predicted metalloprotease
MIVLPHRTGNNAMVTLGSDNPNIGDDQRLQQAQSKADRPNASTDSAAWEALKRFVDPPTGSFGSARNAHQVEPKPPLTELRATEASHLAASDTQETPRALGDVAASEIELSATTTAGIEPKGSFSSLTPAQSVMTASSLTAMTSPTAMTLPTAPAAVTPASMTPASMTPASLSSGALSHEPSVQGVPALPIKPTWPESVPSGNDEKKKRRRWPMLALVTLLIGGAVVALAKPSVLPSSVRRTLHVGSSTDRNAVKTTNSSGKTDGAKIGSEASTSTVPATRPKRAVKGYDPTMRLALKSIDAYWAKQFPDVYDDTYKKLGGGVYAYSSGSRIPTCDGMNLPYLVLQQNAFYCPESDFIAWDDQGLFPRLEKKYGRFLLAIVLAHEWGHAIQERADSDLDTITAEQQADCFAGSWAASLDPKTDPELAKLRDRELDKGLSGFIEFRDLVGMVSTDPGAHGTAFDRIRAFQDGFEGTPSTCAYYEEELPELVAIPYRSFKERFRGGNLPYPEVLPSIKKELALNWKAVYSADPVTTTEAKEFPVCFAQPVSPEGFTENTISYCDDDKTLRYDEKSMRTLYDRIGDFGPATTIGIGWAMADLVQQGKDPSTKNFWVEANCRAGAWAGTMFDTNDPENSQLSPGDLDESVRTILESSAKGASKTYGTGFEQVSAFRAGVLQGSGGCKILFLDGLKKK